MIRTISIGNYMSIQGYFVKMLDNGLMVIRDGERLFTGAPVVTGAAVVNLPAR